MVGRLVSSLSCRREKSVGEDDSSAYRAKKELFPFLAIDNISKSRWRGSVSLLIKAEENYRPYLYDFTS